jgi:hypothetical protein
MTCACSANGVVKGLITLGLPLQRDGHVQNQRIVESEISLLDAKGLPTTLLGMLLAGVSIYGPVKLCSTRSAAIERRLAELR